MEDFYGPGLAMRHMTSVRIQLTRTSHTALPNYKGDRLGDVVLVNAQKYE